MNNGGGWVNERNEEINEIYFWMKRMSEGWLWLIGCFGLGGLMAVAPPMAPPKERQTTTQSTHSIMSEVKSMKWKQLVEWMNKFICSWMKLMRQWNWWTERRPKQRPPLRGKPNNKLNFFSLWRNEMCLLSGVSCSSSLLHCLAPPISLLIGGLWAPPLCAAGLHSISFQEIPFHHLCFIDCWLKRN